MSYFQFWPEFPLVAITLWIAIAIAALYLVRATAHRAIERAARGGHRLLRLVARSASTAAQHLEIRNREVMLALQMEITRRQLEREFHRVAAAVEQDMTKFQHLERSINEHINLMGEDFERSAQVPPAAPGWVEAVDAIAKLQAETNPEPVGRVLQDIHTSVQDQQREVMREYRWAVNARHKILADLRPLWSRVSKQVSAVGRDSRDLLARVHRVDTQMAAFRELCANRGDVRVESFLARWVIALMLSGVALVLAALNINLLALPLGGLLTGQTLLAQLTGVAFTLAVMAAALVLCEGTQVSRLLPLIGGLPRRPRIVLVVVSTALLLILASGEALLLSFTASARTTGSLALATWGAASAGFVVPLLLALFSPALEALLTTSRPVLASMLIAALSTGSILLRLAGRAWLDVGRLLHHVYDLLLFLPLAVEQAIAARKRAAEPVTSIQSSLPVSTKIRPLRFGKVQSGSSE
ncbi:MAG: hypothetical protein JWM78_1322 [Verrucomicrobiaceae bacterium]|nr:hypothetical protein [Verrucomicrobiaceae bacterium]